MPKLSNQQMTQYFSKTGGFGKNSQKQTRQKDGTFEPKCPAQHSSAVVSLALLSALLLVLGAAAVDAQATASPALDSQYVNMNEILKHQQALVQECRQVEAQKLAELKLLVEFDRDNEQVHLGNPVAIKLPAICLLLNGPPGGSGGGSGEPAAPPAMRLDLVNWLYDADDLLPATNKSKRHTDDELAKPGQLLANQWLDLNRAAASVENEIELDGPIKFPQQSAEEKKFAEHMNQMLKEQAFQEAIRTDQARIEPYLSPVVLIPGLAGSRLQARVSKLTRVNIICKREHDWQEMWLTLRSFLPVAIDCWLDNVRLELDPASGFTREPPGVESRVPDFGSVESVRHLDLKSPKLTKYYDEIIEHYTQLGYQPDKNLFAAPYDFRLAPQQIESTFFEPLRELIESATSSSSSSSGGKRATLVCHSMGCTHLLIFLRRQSAAWRQAHVRKVIALSSPWGGSIKALKAILVGDQFSIPLVSETKMRDLARSFPGVAFMLPQPEIFGAPSGNQVAFNEQVLVQTPARNFKVDELEALLKAANLEQHWEWFERTTSLIKPLEPLADVTLDCIHSLNIPTIETIIFRNASDFPNGGDYELVEGDGDGTVNHQSLLVCAQWAAKYPQRIRHKIILNTSHSGLLSHKSTLEHITADVAMGH